MATALSTDDPRHATTLDVRRRVGRAFLAAAIGWVGYLVLAFTLASGYEEALVEASDDLDTPVNKLPAETLAQITQDHPWSWASTQVLLLVPALLIVATRRAGAVTGDRWGRRLAWLGAIVWWAYMLLGVGLLADPNDLPPLTRDLDVLTVPLVSAGSVLSLVGFVVSAWGVRRHGWRRVASTVAAALAAVLLVASVATSIATGWDEPVAPIGLLPAELILGIALLVGASRGTPR